MDKKEKALKFAEELHKKYPNSLTESESKYIDCKEIFQEYLKENNF